ncbi:MAG: type II toxin-antitoxin system HicB family antitoxin [Oceanipulchritudo sp.]
MKPESTIFGLMKAKFTAIIRKEEDQFVALCPDLDIASQGNNQREALDNLREAVSLFLETASPAEVEGRLSDESWITQFEADYATT